MNHNRRTILLALLLGLPALAGCGPTPDSSGPPADHQGQNPLANTPANAPADSAAPAPTGPVKIVMETTKGTMELELYPDKAPLTVANFVSYVRKGFYEGTIFHRVIPGFMIQGGGMTPDMQEKPTDSPIKNEARLAYDAGLKNERGTISMARTSDPDSATSQFFISVADNTMKLDPPATPDGVGYTVFGKITKGMDVADKIVGAPTDPNGPNEGTPTLPKPAILIKSAKVVEAAPAASEGTAANAPSGNAPAANTPGEKAK